jgi:DNA-binding protein H-NS
MASYLELKQRAEKLMQEAEEMRQKEIDEVIADIKEKMKSYGLSAQDLGLTGTGGAGAAGPRRRTAAGKSQGAVKYRGPNGETWSGGRGRKPGWVTQALKEGKNLDEFAV